MGLFANLIGDVPGQATGIFSSATDLAHLADALQDDYDTALTTKNAPEEWEGEAAETFGDVMYDQTLQIADLQEGTRRSAGALEDYGWVVQAEQGRCEGIRATMLHLDAEVDAATGLVEKAQAYLRVLPEVTRNQQDYVDAVAAVRAAAGICAALLAEGAHAEPYNYTDDGRDRGTRRDLRADELEGIAESLENGRLYPDDINQRSIGDCYLLAALSSMARTTEGREHLKEMVQPHYVDGELVGFMVTLYEDPLNPDSGGGRTVFVDDIYQYGAAGSSGGPNAFSVIEAAYGQVYPAGTLPDNSEGNGLTGGRPDASLEELTGTDSEVVRRRRGFLGLGDGYSGAQRDEIIAAGEEGRPAVAATAGMSEEDVKEAVNVTTVTIDGEQEQIEIVGSHAYEVVSSDENGVTLRNPWGYNNPGGTGDDATTPLDATFTMSWEDFETYCSDVSISGGYSS
ncbi:MAG: hypothetical protein ACTHZ5_10075 [Micrococcaceae bacterium]